MEREWQLLNHWLVTADLIVFVCQSVAWLVGWMVSWLVGAKYPRQQSIDGFLGHLIIAEESDANKYISYNHCFIFLFKSMHYCKNVMFFSPNSLSANDEGK